MRYNWILDAGHGGADSGAILKDSKGNIIRKESDDVLTLTKLIKAGLEKHKQTVAMTRTNDTTISLNTRTALENKGNYEYFISIHRNSFSNVDAKGVEVFSYSNVGNGRKLAIKVQNELKDLFTDRGAKTSNFHVLKNTKCSAILIEVGFLSNSNDNKVFDSYIKDIANKIVKACIETVGLTYNSDTSNNIGAATAPIYRILNNGVQVGAYSNIDNICNTVKLELNNKNVSKIEIIKK